jgi:uncharacterized protein YbjT (DUF2867 family)
MRVLVTGGTGVLGSCLVRALAARGAVPRVLSRSSGAADGAEWAVGELESGAGLAAALEGVQAVVHCATTGGLADAAVDVRAARSLLAAAEAAGVEHLLFPGIVGVERARFFPYYRARLEIEALLAASPVPHTILRATQFHELAASFLRRLTVGPVLLAPVGGMLQPVEVEAVGKRLARLALGHPAGRVRDVAGPEILPLKELAREWLRARGERRRILPLWPALGPLRLFTGGRMISEDAEAVGMPWRDWVRERGRETDPYTARTVVARASGR